MISPCEVVPSLEVRESVTLRVAGTKLEELEVGDGGSGLKIARSGDLMGQFECG